MGSDKIKGKFNEAVGGAKREAGDAMDNDEMQRDGAQQELKGKGQGFMGDVKEKVNDLTD